MFEDGVVVKFGQVDKAHENEFFRHFAKSVKAYFDKRGIRACLLGKPTCLVNDRLQIDALLITPKTITIVDFKDYGGQLLLPDEAEFRRGSWVMDSGLQVKGGSSPNPFYQTGLQRNRLMKILELTCRNRSTFDPHHISTLICFQQSVEVQGPIPGRYRPYFHIADADTFLEKLFDIVSAGRDDADLLEPKFIAWTPSQRIGPRLHHGYASHAQKGYQLTGSVYGACLAPLVGFSRGPMRCDGYCNVDLLCAVSCRCHARRVTASARITGGWGATLSRVGAGASGDGQGAGRQRSRTLAACTHQKPSPSSGWASSYKSIPK